MDLKLKFSRNRIRNSIATVLAIVFLVFGVAYFPFPNSPFQNEFNVPPKPIVAYARLDIPANLTEIPSYPSLIRVELSGSDYVVGVKLTLNIELDSTGQLKNHVKKIVVFPNQAMPYPSPERLPYPIDPGGMLPQFIAFMLESDPTSNAWFGRNYTIQYRVPGSFGMFIELYKSSDDDVPIKSIQTDALYTIGSEDTVIAKHNEALTTSLTFFVLAFAALEFRSKDSGCNCQTAKQDGERNDHGGKKLQSEIGGIEPKPCDGKPTDEHKKK